MARFRYQHIKSSVEGKAPTAAQLKIAEIGVNDFAGDEKLFIKNSTGDVVDFPRGYSREYIDDNERVVAGALNDLNTRKLDASAYTPTDLSNYYQKSETSGATELSDEFALCVNKTEVDQVIDETTSASTNPVSSKAVYKAATDNELVWTNAFVALSGTVSAHTANTEIHVTAADKAAWDAKLDASDLDDYYEKTETSGATELETAFNGKANTSDIADFFDDAKYEVSGTTHVINFYNGNTIKATIDATDFIKDGMIDSVSLETTGGTTYLVITWNTDAGKSQTSLNVGDLFDADNYYTKTEIDNKLGSGFTVSSVTQVIEENEEIVSEALNDLNTRKLDASAYTPTDLTNYYTKSETSGATEISNALAAKQDAFTEGRAIDITNNVVSLDLPISAGTGTNSIIEGTATTASGQSSHAEGENTKAYGRSSHAEGGGTIASGRYSHAEGDNTIASGLSSHAEGRTTVAASYYAHAEGGNSVASGLCSHAEGENTKAYGRSSHAEGSGTTASGITSHAEGYNTSATTSYTHSEGSDTKANGEAAHAEGSGTTASGADAHAEGYNTSATTSYTHSEGSDTKANGEAAHAEGSGTTASGSSSHAEGWKTIAGGNYSHAEGRGNIASGSSSHAEGSGTEARGNSSHAEGNGTSATTSYTHSEGWQTIASGSSSHAEGWNTIAGGNYSHSEGYNTKANGEAAHSEGSGTTANGEAAHAEGSGTTASGNYSHSEGYDTKANGEVAHAEGRSTTASGNYSHSEGYLTIATTSYTHVEGYGTKANGEAAHAEGRSTTASGECSHAEGSGTIAGSYRAHAEGNDTKASGSTSHAEGWNTIAGGESSHSEGYATSALTHWSHTEGHSTKATNRYEHASGRYNSSVSASTTFGNSGNTLFSVGNGTADDARHNAFEIRQNGDIYISSGGTNTNPMIKLQALFDRIAYLENKVIYNGHAYVEIGGLKWATMNIGASQPSDYGLYFAWGDTQGYTAEQVGSGEGQKYFGWADYKYGNGTSSPGATGMTKYNATDGLTTLEASDDAAVANWGGSWRMPTTAEFQALGAAVNTAWTQVNNVYGILCTDKTDSSKTLFFPAAGYCYNGSVVSVGSFGYYWSSSLYTDNRQYAYNLSFYRGNAGWDDNHYRYFGYAVRPVVG